MENKKSPNESILAGKMTSIIILSYNTLQFTRSCIESIRRHTAPGSYEIIVIDNASKDGSVDWLKSQQDLICVYNEENVGFPAGCNQGMKIAKGTELLLLNSDTVVTPRWLDNMRLALYSTSKVGAVSCLTNACSNNQQINVPYHTLPELLEFAEEFNHSDSKKWHPWFRLVGFCFLLRRKIYETIGGMDEIFSPGNYEDDDYSLRIRKAGYELLLCHDTFIHHYGSATFNHNMSSEELEKKRSSYMELLKRNRIIFSQKWGVNEDFGIFHLTFLNQLIGKIPPHTKILALDVGTSSDLFMMHYLFPQNEFAGVSSSELGVAITKPSFPVIYCKNLAEDMEKITTERYDFLLWLMPVENGAETLPLLHRLSNRFLTPKGKLYFYNDENLCYLTPSINVSIENNQKSIGRRAMIVPVQEVSFAPSVRNITLHEGENEFTAMTLGPGSYLVNGSLEYGSIDCHVLIGRYSSLGHRLKFVIGLNHDGSEVTTYPFRDLLDPPNDGVLNHYFASNHYQIIIGNDVWIGCDVTILGGVRIGNGAIIGAGAVIAKDVPPYAVVAGNPARIVKFRFAQDVIDKLQEIKWWNWPEEKIKENVSLFEHPSSFVNLFPPPTHSNIGEDIARDIQSLKDSGHTVFFFVADFAAKRPIWEKVLRQYLAKFTDNDKTVLLFASENNEDYQDHIGAVEELLDKESPNHPSVALLGAVMPILSDLVRMSDYFITTRKDVSSQGVDFASGHGVGILSGLDYEIFSSETIESKQR